MKRAVRAWHRFGSHVVLWGSAACTGALGYGAGLDPAWAAAGVLGLGGLTQAMAVSSGRMEAAAERMKRLADAKRDEEFERVVSGEELDGLWNRVPDYPTATIAAASLLDTPPSELKGFVVIGLAVDESGDRSEIAVTSTGCPECTVTMLNLAYQKVSGDEEWSGSHDGH